jgi:hypothetical protein
MITNNIVWRARILLQISEFYVIISSKSIALENSRCPIPSQGLRREVLVSPVPDRADALKRGRQRASGSLLAPQPVEKAEFGLANGEPSAG